MPIRYLKVVDTATHEEHVIDTGGVPATDATPTQGSTNPVSSGGVYSALDGKQNTLTFDATPTSRSSNPVSSDGVYTALQAKQDSVPYTSCSTEANVAAKEASTSAANFVLAVGARILVSFSHQNTASNPTLNVDSTGAKAIYFKGSQITNGNEIALVGGLILLVYDGYHWNIVGNYLNTLNTAGASDFANHKLYPVGALYPYDETVTYSNSNIYFGSDNEVYSNGKKVAHADVEGGIAIVSNGNTHAAIASGQYVYVKDHSTLSEGLYKAASAIAANATLSTSNLTACSNGGMNDLKSEITSQNNKIAKICADVIADGAGAHNAIYRGKYLGSSVTAEQWAAIRSGTFADLFIGDYWTINGVNWRIAAFDYWVNANSLSTHHAVIVPDTNLASSPLNSTHTTAGAYYNSDFRTGNNGNTGRATAIAAVNAAFGSGNILTYKDYLHSAVVDGHPSGQEWADCTVELMNEEMVYGGHIFAPIGPGTSVYSNYTTSKSQLPLFQHDHSRISNRANWWLRSVVSGAHFAFVNNNGSADYNGAAHSRGVRPAFGIC